MLIVLALGAALLYGSADFLGGAATRRAALLAVLLTAGVAGVVAGGAVVVRDQRKRQAYTADEVRARLHQRLAESDAQSR